MTNTTEPSKRWISKDLLKRILLVGLCVLMVGWVLWLVVVPRVVERVAVGTLRDMGFQVDSLRVDSIGLSGSRVSDIRLQDERLNIASIDVTYSIGSLLSGRVDQITIDGVHWIITYDQHGPDLAIPQQLMAGDSDKQQQAASPAQTSASLPLNRLKIRDVRVDVAYDNIRVPMLQMQGDVQTKAGGTQAHVATICRVMGVPLEIHGDLDLEKSTSLWTTQIDLFQALRQSMTFEDWNTKLSWVLPKKLDVTVKTSPEDGVQFDLLGGQASATLAVTEPDFSLTWHVATATGVESGVWSLSASTDLETGVKTLRYGPFQMTGMAFNTRQAVQTNDQSQLVREGEALLKIERLEILDREDVAIAWIEGVKWPSYDASHLGIDFHTDLHVNLSRIITLPEEMQPELSAKFKLKVVDDITSLSLHGTAKDLNPSMAASEPLSFRLDMAHDLSQYGEGETTCDVDLPASTLGHWLEQLELVKRETITGDVRLTAKAILDDSFNVSTTVDIKTDLTANLANLIDLPETLEPVLQTNVNFAMRDGRTQLAVKGTAKEQNPSSRQLDPLNFALDLNHDITNAGEGQTAFKMDTSISTIENWFVASGYLTPGTLTGNVMLNGLTLMDQVDGLNPNVQIQTDFTADLAKLAPLPRAIRPKLSADMTFDLKDGVVNLQIAGQVIDKDQAGNELESVTFTFNMDHDINDYGKGESKFRVSIPATTLTSWLAVMEMIEPDKVNGNITFDAFAKLNNNFSLTTGGQIALNSINLTDKMRNAKFFNLHGNITFNSLFGPTTPPRQAILIDKLIYGEIEFLNNTALITVYGLNDILVDRMTMDPATGGRFLVHAYRYVPGKPIRSELYIEQWNFIQFLEKVTQQRIRGNGLVYGRIPFELEGNTLRLSPRTWLIGEPEGGTISILDEKMRAIIIDPLRNANNPTTDIVAQRVEEALGNMKYDFLEARLVPMEDDSLKCEIEIRGQGIDGDKQEIGGLVVNLYNFGMLLNRFLLTPMNNWPNIEDLIDRAGGRAGVLPAANRRKPQQRPKKTNTSDNPGVGELPDWMNDDGSAP